LRRTKTGVIISLWTLHTVKRPRKLLFLQPKQINWNFPWEASMPTSHLYVRRQETLHPVSMWALLRKHILWTLSYLNKIPHLELLQIA